MDYDNNYSDYIIIKEPDHEYKSGNWNAAIGLQRVDGLVPSNYLVEVAKENIKGNIDIDEVEKRINNYYKTFDKEKERTIEADKVAINITKQLNNSSFNLNPSILFNIHENLFKDVFKHAGKKREYNFIKKEWVLNDDSVTYASYETIMSALNYDFELEKNFSYKDLSIDEAIKHLSRFISDIWQIHSFCEGNTRVIAVFTIKYLRTFGFKINEEVFAKHSWYFRNALVRANYKNFEKNIFEDTSYLEKFFYNLLTNSNYELKNRYEHIDYEIKENNFKNNNITLEEQVIINIIKNNSFVKQEEIAGNINKSLRTVKNMMNKMKEKGLIERKNSRKNGEWIVLI